MAQPLPAFFDISTGRRRSAVTVATIAPGFKHEALPALPSPVQAEPFTAIRNLTA